MINELKGRTIENVPYSGLIESLTKINLICHTAGETRDHLKQEDLMSFLSQISEIAAEGLAFAGVTREEANYVLSYLLSGMRTESKDIN